MKGRERGPTQVRSDVPVIENMGLLAGGIRMEVLTCLAEQPRDVTGVADRLGLAVNHVSQALRLLREHGLVDVQRKQRNRIHALTDRVRVSIDSGKIRLGILGPRGDIMLLQTAIDPRRDAQRDAGRGDDAVSASAPSAASAFIEQARQWFGESNGSA